MKFRAAREATCALLILAWRPAISRPMRSIVVYSDTNCKGTPIRVTLVGDEECTSDKAVCTSDGQSVGTQYTSSHCVDVDRHTYVAEIFSEFSFVTMEYYTDDGCDTFQGLNSFLAAGTCQHVGFGNDTSSSIVRLYSNGSAVLQLFEDTFCGIDANSTMHIDSSDITEHTCFGSSSGVRFFSSQSPTSSYSSPGLSVGEIIGTVVGSVVFLLLVAAVFVWRRRSKSKRWHPSEEVESPIDHQCDDSKLNTSYESDATERGTMAEVHVPRGSSMNSGVGGVWDDEAIVAVRIPRKKVFVHELI
ncbi:hypothetical protein KRP22_012008 [Phytophthora ramorum]|nr:hypothetical protein KRP22_11846 [Phytophthora ramorum]